jgi:MftR C-terminal domain
MLSSRYTESRQLTLATPEIRTRAIDGLARSIDTVAMAIAKRSHRPPDDLTARTTAGAVIGVLFATMLPWHGARDPDLSDNDADRSTLQSKRHILPM